jgi:hypothetical protein
MNVFFSNLKTFNFMNYRYPGMGTGNELMYFGYGEKVSGYPARNKISVPNFFPTATCLTFNAGDPRTLCTPVPESPVI